jgi:hypothetical protein
MAIINMQKSMLLLAGLMAYLSLQTGTEAFGVSSPLQRPLTFTSTISSNSALYAENNGRRGFFGGVKRIFLGAAAMATLKQTVPPALADDSPTTGRIVEMQIANLDGEVGKVGTIRIQLRPEWAPRGVQRFEV